MKTELSLYKQYFVVSHILYTVIMLQNVVISIYILKKSSEKKSNLMNKWYLSKLQPESSVF